MRSARLRHGSLFSGIGGFDLAAQWCGWINSFHCEINDFCNAILNFYWPKATAIKNIIGYEWKKWKGTIDVLSGGFPCQPFSVAGKRLGKDDARYLWPYMLKAIRAIQPSWVVGENVRGITSWNEGMVFNEVLSDMEAAGYEVLPLLLPAAGINAPHKRERVWFIAHRNCLGRKLQKIITHTDSNKRCERRCDSEKFKEAGCHISEYDSWDHWDPWKNFPSQSPLCVRNDGLPLQLDGITFPKWRAGSLKVRVTPLYPR